MDASDQQELYEYAAKVIKHKARQLVDTAGFTESDREDLEQELMLHVLERLPKFDATKATAKTFVARVIDRKVGKLIRHRNCQMRDPQREDFSLNEHIDDGDGGTIERSQTIAADELDRRLFRRARSDQEAVELALDVEAMLQRLPDNLRRVCELLKTASIAEAARQLGLPRTTLHDQVKKIRKFFEQAGLRDYLPGGPSSQACAG